MVKKLKKKRHPHEKTTIPLETFLLGRHPHEKTTTPAKTFLLGAVARVPIDGVLVTQAAGAPCELVPSPPRRAAGPSRCPHDLHQPVPPSSSRGRMEEAGGRASSPQMHAPRGHTGCLKVPAGQLVDIRLGILFIL